MQRPTQPMLPMAAEQETPPLAEEALPEIVRHMAALMLQVLLAAEEEEEDDDS